MRQEVVGEILVVIARLPAKQFDRMPGAMFRNSLIRTTTHFLAFRVWISKEREPAPCAGPSLEILCCPRRVETEREPSLAGSTVRSSRRDCSATRTQPLTARSWSENSARPGTSRGLTARTVSGAVRRAAGSMSSHSAGPMSPSTPTSRAILNDPVSGERSSQSRHAGRRRRFGRPEPRVMAR